MKKIIKRILIGSLLIVTFLLAIAVLMLLRGQTISKVTYSVPSHTDKGLRIVALADLHGDLPKMKMDTFVQKIQSTDPDLIVYLGDMIDRSTPEESVVVLERLTQALITIAPICYVDGNHEQNVHSVNPQLYADLNDSLKSIGAVQLENETVQLLIRDNPESSSEWIFTQSSATNRIKDLNGTLVNICGITTHYFWGPTDYSLSENLRSMDGINILLCHYPESVIWYDAFGSGGLDLAICGHTHGGLIRFPIVGGMFAPEQGWWPKYDAGQFPVYTDTTWREYGGAEGAEYLGTMIISSGLAGEHGIPRINNPKEISVIEIGNMD